MKSKRTELIHHDYEAPAGFESMVPGVHKASTVLFKNMAALRALFDATEAAAAATATAAATSGAAGGAPGGGRPRWELPALAGAALLAAAAAALWFMRR